MKKVFIGLVLLSVLFFVGASVNKSSVEAENSNVQLSILDLNAEQLAWLQTIPGFSMEAEMASKCRMRQDYCQPTYGGCNYSGICCLYINCQDDYCCPLCGAFEPAWNQKIIYGPGPCDCW